MMRVRLSLRLVALRLGRLARGLACQLPPLTARMMMLNQPKMIIPLTMEEICCLFQLALRPLSRCVKSQ